MREWNNTKIKVTWEYNKSKDRKGFNGLDAIDFYSAHSLNSWVNLELAARLMSSGYKGMSKKAALAFSIIYPVTDRRYRLKVSC